MQKKTSHKKGLRSFLNVSVKYPFHQAQKNKAPPGTIKIAGPFVRKPKPPRIAAKYKYLVRCSLKAKNAKRVVEATKKLNIPSAVAVLIIIDAPRLARTKKAAKKAFLLFEIFFVNQNVTNAQSNPKITLGNLKANSEKPKVFKLMT